MPPSTNETTTKIFSARLASSYCLLLVLWVHGVNAKGGGKRTYGSKSQSASQSQNLDCTDQSCIDSTSWASFFAATLALVGPLCLLLALILVIKLCYARIHPNLLEVDA